MPIVTPPAASASVVTPGCSSLGTSTSTGLPGGC
jgi:hypothetical protein